MQQVSVSPQDEWILESLASFMGGHDEYGGEDEHEGAVCVDLGGGP